MSGDAAAGGVPRASEGDADVKDEAGARPGDGELGALQVAGNPLPLFRGDIGDDLQLPVGLTGHDTRRGRRLQSPQPAGIGHHHALYVFDDVPADADVHLLGGGAQPRAARAAA